MSTTNDPHHESPAPAPEELVAYLDGELSPDECRQVEERLASDADYRQQLHDLDQAWEALDSLPATSPGDDFARTTIEMVTLAAREEQKSRTAESVSATRSRRRWWAIVGGVAVVLGFVATRLFAPDANARLLHDLPMITQMNLLAQIQDIEFLRRLSREVPLDKLAADDAAVERETTKFAAASNNSPEARRQWIESLPADQKADLAAQAEQFDRLPKEERDRLRELQRQFAAAPDAPELQKTLAAYGQWLTRRNSGERSNLRGMADDDRIRRIHESLRQENEQAARRLTEADAKQLKQVVFEIYDEYKDDEDFRKAMRRRDGGDRPRREGGTPEEMALVVTSWALWNEETDGKTRDRITKALTPDAQKHLEQLERRGGEPRMKWQVWLWMRDALHPKREPGDIERFFAEDLDPNQREYLLSLPRERMEVALERMYFGDKMGLRGNEWLGTFGEPGRGMPPGRPGWRPEGPPPGGPDTNRNRRGPGPDGPPNPDGHRRRPPPQRLGDPPPEPRGQEPI